MWEKTKTNSSTTCIEFPLRIKAFLHFPSHQSFRFTVVNRMWAFCEPFYVLTKAIFFFSFFFSTVAFFKHQFTTYQRLRISASFQNANATEQPSINLLIIGNQKIIFFENDWISSHCCPPQSKSWKAFEFWQYTYRKYRVF